MILIDGLVNILFSKGTNSFCLVLAIFLYQFILLMKARILWSFLILMIAENIGRIFFSKKKYINNRIYNILNQFFKS